MKRDMFKGQVSIPLAATLTGATFLISGLTSYFTSQMKTQASIGDVRTEYSAEISEDRQRLAKLEEAIDSIKDDSKTTKNDIKQILQLLKD